MKLNNKPMKHQIVGISFALKHHYSLNCDEMGLGKTFQALAVAAASGLRTLVVAPAFLRLNWEKEVLDHLNGCRVAVLSSAGNINKIVEELPNLDMVIISYSQLASSIKLFQWASFIIGDEAHYLKNLEAKRTTLFHNYVRRFKPERLLLLTGTPVKNRVPDFYSLLALCGQTRHKTNGKNILDRFRTSYQFSKHFSNESIFKMRQRGRLISIRTFEGIKNEKELKTYFRHKYLRRLAKDVLDLKEMTTIEVPVSYKDKGIELKKAWEKYTGKVDDHIMRVKAETAQAKTKFTIDYVKNIASQGESVIIFTDHVLPAKTINSALKKSALIIGDTPMDDRNEYVKQFQAGLLDYIVLTIGAGSTGLTLTKSRHMVFNDLSWVNSNNEQASKRNHRIGQTKKCIRHIITGGRTDSQINQAILANTEVVEKLL